jgi:CBS domain-containing protein
MRIEEVMTRHVFSCGPDDTAANAAKVMWDHDCGFVPIVNERRVPIGVLTDRDICMAAYTRGKAPHEMSVRSVMSNSVRMCTKNASVSSVEHLMAEAQVRRLPVVDDAGTLIGIVSLSDLARGRDRSAKDRVTEHIFADVAKTLAAISKPHSSASLPAE